MSAESDSCLLRMPAAIAYSACAGAKAVAVLPDIPSLRSTIMTDAQGQQYNCSIPSSPSTWSTAVTQQQVCADPLQAMHKLPDVLAV